MSELISKFSCSSAALARMLAVEVWEQDHGHPHGPCPPGCLIQISADQKAAEIWGAIQPPPPKRTTTEELMSKHGKAH